MDDFHLVPEQLAEKLSRTWSKGTDWLFLLNSEVGFSLVPVLFDLASTLVTLLAHGGSSVSGGVFFNIYHVLSHLLDLPNFPTSSSASFSLKKE